MAAPIALADPARKDSSTHDVEVHHDDSLISVLDSLGIAWSVVRVPNGVPGIIRVTLNSEADYRLEQLIHGLSELRWRYTPGRALQLELPVLDVPRWDDAPH